MSGILIEKKQSEPKSNLLEKKSEEGKKPTRFYSNQQEKSIAKAVGGNQTANSGATPFTKGDVLTTSFLLEAKTKTTHADSISVKKEWIEKNRREALFMGKKYSAVVFNFGPAEPNHYIIDEYLFQELLVYLNSKE